MNDDIPSPFRILGWIFAVAVVLTLFFGILGVTLGVVGLPFRVFSQASRIVDRTIDADNVIANYEWFKQQCQDIKAQGRIITDAEQAKADFEASAGPRSSWDFQDKQEHNRLSANVTGAKQYEASLVADYNARARMANRALFNTEPCDVQVAR